MKLDIEIDDHLDLEVGDSVIVIKKDGSVLLNWYDVVL